MSKMSKRLKNIAILSNNAALASILHMVLANNRNVRVRIFANEMELAKYINIINIDLLVLDCKQLDYAIISTIAYLKNSPSTNRANFKTIILCNKIENNIGSFCKAVGINELMIKPTSPSYFENRVLSLVESQNNKKITEDVIFHHNKNVAKNKRSDINYSDNIVFFSKKYKSKQSDNFIPD